MRRNGYPPRKEGIGDYAKKKTARYIERDEGQREEFVRTLEDLPDDAEIFYADEAGFEEYYSRTYGYAHRGERVYGEVAGKHFDRTSVAAAINEDNKITAPFAFKGCMNGALFQGWLEEIFVPCLTNPQQSVLIIDNATHHSKDAIQDTADGYGFRVIFLPKYSPDLNPIEKVWANIKNWLRLHMHEFGSFWDGLIHAFESR